jgi:hypothetical protein
LVDFWFCAVGLGVGFGLISVGGLARSGLQGGSRWACGVAHGGGFHFWSIPVVLGVGFFCFLFYVAPNTQCKIFVGSFSKVQTNTGKTIIFFKIIFIYKHFMVENNLHRNKRSLRFSCYSEFM